MKTLLFSFLALGFITFNGPIALANDEGPDAGFYQELAEYHSPVVLHEVGKHPSGDVPVLFDFDGDFRGDNNWENLDKFELKPAVYFEVIETKTHYFITYAFFHPRDYSYICMPIVCHENDLEGAIFTVKKDGSYYGKVVYAEALAHLSISGRDDPFLFYSFQNNSGRFVERVFLRIEDMGHGIHVWNGNYPKKYEIYLLDDETNTARLPKEPRRYTLHPLRFFWNLHYKANASNFVDKYYNFKGTRFDIPNLPASFFARKYGSGRASFPWAWSSTGKKKGEWFLDPAYWVYERMHEPRDFSLDYVYHPYLPPQNAVIRSPAGN